MGCLTAAPAAVRRPLEGTAERTDELGALRRDEPPAGDGARRALAKPSMPRLGDAAAAVLLPWRAEVGTPGARPAFAAVGAAGVRLPRMLFLGGVSLPRAVQRVWCGLLFYYRVGKSQLVKENLHWVFRVVL